MLRGHLELLDAGNPEEVAETRALLLDEIDRMSRLVGDLILLAKSDRPDFLTPAPVDLAGLTARPAREGPRPGRPGLGAGRRPPSVTGRASTSSGSPRRCSSSPTTRSSTPAPGDEVAIGSSYDGGDGRGSGSATPGPACPPADRERIFERFGRSAVPAGDEGFGLGLSIVRAIAEATAARSRVEDAEPPGARFVITPARRPTASDRGGGRVARILIVEDEERIASFVAKGLRADGHRRRPWSPTAATGSTTR